MLYRKAPAHPPRLLLRVVAAAGASAVVGAMACSSSSPLQGVAACPEDAGDCNSQPDAYVGGGGVMACIQDGEPCGTPYDATPVGVAPCVDEGGACVAGLVDAGIVGFPPDAGDDASGDAVLVGSVDAPVGVAIAPDAGSDG